MDKKKGPVCLVPLGKVPQEIPDFAAGYIDTYLHRRPEILPAMDTPRYAFDHIRFQYNALTVIETLKSEFAGEYEKVLGLVEVDLFVPIFTHVFGEAELGGECALVSLYRLRKATDGTSVPWPVFSERLAKVALHEMGHLYNLLHCTDENCLMRFASGLEEMDAVPLVFCEYCEAYLQDRLCSNGDGKNLRGSDIPARIIR